MKTYSSTIETYRAALGEYWEVKLISFQVRDRDTGDLHWYHFSSRDEDETIQVRNQATGDLEFRDYFGGGHILSMDPLIRSEGTGVRNFNIVLSGVSDPVREMVFGYDARGGVVEVHIGEVNGGTGLLIDTPVCEFEGFVDNGDINDGATDMETEEPAEATITLSINSHIAALQRTNPAVRSYEAGQERSGDAIFRWADEANTWEARWGKGPKKHKKNDNGDGRNRSGGGGGDGRGVPSP
jgi:hypothetical protein